jgi:hypothetical protein
MQEIFRQVEDEFNRSNELYPQFHSTHEGYAVIKEEVDELWDYIKQSKSVLPNNSMISETIQIMAMCVKFIKSFEVH